MRHFWPHPRPTETETLEVESAMCVSTIPTMESEKHLSLRTAGLSDYLLLEGAYIPEGVIQANGHLAKNGGPSITSARR